MTKRIYRSICIVAVAVLLASLAIIMGVLYNYFSKEQMSQLRAQTLFAAQGVENEGTDYFDELQMDNCRITLIAPDGTVIYDNEAAATSMENHMEREEVREAFDEGEGESSRYSTTLMERQLYAARKLSDGSVLRLSAAQLSSLNLLLNMIEPIALTVFVALILSLILASRLAKKIVKPLNELSLDAPEKNAVYEELAPMVERLKSQQKQLSTQSLRLRRKQDEFDAATLNMSEGLVLLSETGDILSINSSAAQLLGISRGSIGVDILELNNSFEIQELLRIAQSGERAEKTIPLDGGNYQMNASPVVSDGRVTGIALLILDITEKEKAEKMRREFTANVSHELKTPLQTIAGSAELLENGLVKSEDIPAFAANIHSEARRMIALVEDVIGLSHLDETTAEFEREEVDLYAVAELTVRNLTPLAREKGVSLALSGSPAIMPGVPNILGSIVYNLCDNAIKYNSRGGSVDVSVEPSESGIVLKVADDGIGIPEDEQNRVFERFYRVDKSHSREIGGTGLGLSIVKHAAKIHNAKIELNSVIGGGTTVTVVFPKNGGGQEAL